jgi:hypothetical protein
VSIVPQAHATFRDLPLRGLELQRLSWVMNRVLVLTLMGIRSRPGRSEAVVEYILSFNRCAVADIDLDFPSHRNPRIDGLEQMGLDADCIERHRADATITAYDTLTCYRLVFNTGDIVAVANDVTLSMIRSSK